MTIKKYTGHAGGWGALKSTATHLFKSDNIAKNIKNLLKTNQDHGFDCPGCAWGEKDEPGRFRFCENGAKAVNWEATSRRIGAEFFKEHSVSWLRKQSGYFLEFQGRLAEPLIYNAKTDHYEPISWESAYSTIAHQLNALEDPNQAEFYTSGRASNEAAFLYQLFVRKFGTNNFPDCSNMCHEASGVALTESIGIGKGTVKIDDFEFADAIFVFGQNPGTNHPRMLDTLSHASRKGASIVTFNTLKERGLERFANPQSPVEMISGGATSISQYYFTPNLGGDMACVRGMVKVLLERHKLAQSDASGKTKNVFDLEFIQAHTQGLDEYLKLVEETSWEHITQQSGLTIEQLTQAATIYQNAKNVIVTWAMGITQHKHSVATIQEITNLQLLFGQIGKAGAGLCPVRGHSNVQGDRTMGINEKPDSKLLESIAKVFSFDPPKENGHNTVEAIEAMLSGKSKAFIGLGGNFVSATPDTAFTEQALANCNLTVNIVTKLNQTHLHPGKVSIILPCLGRTDIDLQGSGEQSVTVEDSFSMVHKSKGVVESNTENMRSEPAIIAGIAHATLGNSPVNWLELASDYNLIRDYIAQTFPEFKDMNERLSHPGGFYLGNSATELVWNTSTKKAQLAAHHLPDDIIPASIRALTQNRIFLLQTLRSHDQYNTTVYGFEDRYRGISGERNIILMNPLDIEDLQLKNEDLVDVEALWPDEVERKINNFKLVAYDIPKGNIAAYFPEANPLVALKNKGDKSDTPASKSIAVTVNKAENVERII